MNGQPYYRCKFPAEYAAVAGLDHPKTAYLRQELITAALDTWLADLLRPKNLEATIDALVTASGSTGEGAAVEAARRTLKECDRKLSQHRAALEAGADAKLVTRWMMEVEAGRSEAELILRAAPAAAPTRDELKSLVNAVRDPFSLLRRADPQRKAELYQGLGLRIEWNPAARDQVSVELPLVTDGRVGGGI